MKNIEMQEKNPSLNAHAKLWWVETRIHDIPNNIMY